MCASRREAGTPDTSDRPGPECGEESRASVSATVRREFLATISTERSTRPSADRKRSRASSRVVQRVGGASGEPDLLSRCAAECWAIRILPRMCREMAISHRRTAEDGAVLLADLDVAMAAAEQHATLPDGRGGGLTVTVKIDALAVRTASRRRRLVTRARLGLEGSRPVAFGGGPGRERAGRMNRAASVGSTAGHVVAVSADSSLLSRYPTAATATPIESNLR